MLEATGHPVLSTDLVYRGFGVGGFDFLDHAYPYSSENIITNPPYKLAFDFVEMGFIGSDPKLWLAGYEVGPALPQVPVQIGIGTFGCTQVHSRGDRFDR